jgi:D-sedoheptulose 7-phosphate isomerase
VIIVSEIDSIRSILRESAEVKQATAERNAEDIAEVVDMIATSLKEGGKVIICGNGISAADGQHMACSLRVRFKKDRRCLPVIALGTDPTYMTAAANDFGFERVFSRAVEGLADEGDILIGISTSGNSGNVIEAANMAHSKRAKVIGLTGKTGGKLKGIADLNIIIPSNSSPRIQETHRAVMNILCELVEARLFP